MGVGDENNFCFSWKVGMTHSVITGLPEIEISPAVDRGLAGGVTGGV